MIQRHPRSTRTDTLFPYTTLFRSPWPVAPWPRTWRLGRGLNRSIRRGGRSCDDPPRWTRWLVPSIDPSALRSSFCTRCSLEARWHLQGGSHSTPGARPPCIMKPAAAPRRFYRTVGSVRPTRHPLPISTAVRELTGSSFHSRSEERRGGKECVSTCSYRWSPYH